MLRRGVLVLSLATGVATGVAVLGSAPAQAAQVSKTLVGSTATVDYDAANDTSITIGKSGGNLTIDGSVDWDSATGLDQTLADAAGSQVVINAGDGVDIISVGAPGDTFASTITVHGGADADFVNVDVATGAADSFTVHGNDLTVPGGGHVAWDDFTDQVNLRTGGGNDVVTVTMSASSPQFFYFGGDDDDTLKLANGTAIDGALGNNSAFRGGPGTDTVDYSAWTTPVSVDLGLTARFEGNLSAAATVPPSGSAATGFASIEFTSLATSTFDYEVDVDGLTAAQITDAHLHSGAPGTNGAAILTFGAGASWSDPDLPVGTNPADLGSGVTEPGVTEPALRAGNTYVDVHAAGGDIRGQLVLDTDDGYGGSGTGLPGVFTVENVIGGSGNDTFKGSVPVNAFTCGGGQDSVTTGPGDTVSGCETVNGVTTPPPAAPVGSVSALKPKVTAKGKKVTIDSRATAACPAGATGACTAAGSATAKIGRKTVTLGTASVAVAAGQSSGITVKVAKKAAKAWRKAGKVKVTVTVTLTVPGGSPVTVTVTKKLKAPPAP